MIIIKEIVVKTTIEADKLPIGIDKLYERLKRDILKEINKDHFKQKTDKKDR